MDGSPLFARDDPSTQCSSDLGRVFYGEMICVKLLLCTEKSICREDAVGLIGKGDGRTVLLSTVNGKLYALCLKGLLFV